MYATNLDRTKSNLDHIICNQNKSLVTWKKYERPNPHIVTSILIGEGQRRLWHVGRNDKFSIKGKD